MGRHRSGETQEWGDTGVGRHRSGETQEWGDTGVGGHRSGETQEWGDTGVEREQLTYGMPESRETTLHYIHDCI